MSKTDFDRIGEQQMGSIISNESNKSRIARCSPSTFFSLTYRLYSITYLVNGWLSLIRLRFRSTQSTLLIDILEKLYENTSLTFEETTFETSSGVRQGGPESPNLFNLYIDFVMRLFLEKSSDIQEIKFFEYKFRINCRAFTREQRILMRNNNLRSWGTSIIP